VRFASSEQQRADAKTNTTPMKTRLINIALIAVSFATATAATAHCYCIPPTVPAHYLLPTTPADSATHTLTVSFSNVAKRSGMLYVGLYNSAASFDASDAYRKTRIEVLATGEISVSFDALPAGKYAIRAFQDLNDNMKLDRSGQMPTEPFGFSNVKMLMGPPIFIDCALDLPENKTVSISLISM